MVPIVPSSGHTEADGEWALELAKKNSVEELEELAVKRNVQNTRLMYGCVVFITVSFSIVVGANSWILPYFHYALWSVSLAFGLLLLPICGVIAGLGFLEKIDADRRTFALAKKIRVELDTSKDAPGTP